MARFRLYPDVPQEQQLLGHCAHARYIWNLAVEQHRHWKPGRKSAPGFAEQCRQLTEARAENEWLRAGSAIVQQQALRDFWRAKQRFFESGFGHPDWRRKHYDEGFRIVDTCEVRKLNRRWAQVKVPKVGWVKFRLSSPGLPVAKSYRITFRNGQWHVAFAVIPGPVPAPGNGQAIGIDRGVVITAALSDGRKLNCPQLTRKERARIRKHQRRAARAPKGSEQKAAEYARVARLKARETARRKDWCEKTSTELALYDVVRFEKLNIVNMTASAKGTPDKPGRNVAQKAGLNRAILAQGWGLLRRRTKDKASSRVEDVPAPFTSLRCSACGWIDKNSRKSQAEYVCSSCGFTCNADINAALNVAAGHAGGTTPRKRASVREPYLANP